MKKCETCKCDTPNPYAQEKGGLVFHSRACWELYLIEKNKKQLEKEFPKFNQKAGWGGT